MSAARGDDTPIQDLSSKLDADRSAADEDDALSVLNLALQAPERLLCSCRRVGDHAHRCAVSRAGGDHADLECQR
jgi:hypothetical protein